jgi:4-hydroxy-4-methyl-2-oxoglutarate aldolase
VTDDLLERLRALDACAISDAADRLGLDTVALGLLRLSGARVVVGRAVTVTLVPVGEAPPSPRHLCTAAVDASGPGDVIVVAHGGRTHVSGWGGNLSLAAARRGIEGVIVDGACRDLQQTRDIGLPLFARNAVPVTARGRVAEAEWNTPVTISGVTANPGDLVLADVDGVVFLPAEQAAEIVGVAEQVMAKEARMAHDISAGTPISEVMGTDYERMLEAR